MAPSAGLETFVEVVDIDEMGTNAVLLMVPIATTPERAKTAEAENFMIMYQMRGVMYKYFFFESR